MQMNLKGEWVNKKDNRIKNISHSIFLFVKNLVLGLLSLKAIAPKAPIPNA
jgi:hypothetical protein